MLPDLHPGVMLHKKFLLGPWDFSQQKRIFRMQHKHDKPGGFGSVILAFTVPARGNSQGFLAGMLMPGGAARISCLSSRGNYPLLGSAKFMAVNVSTRGRRCNS